MTENRERAEVKNRIRFLNVVNEGNCEYLPSIHYGGVEERIKKAAFHKAHCES